MSEPAAISSRHARRVSIVEEISLLHLANHVLESALKPGVTGIPKTLFEKCKGLILISVVEVGFIVSQKSIYDDT